LAVELQSWTDRSVITIPIVPSNNGRDENVPSDCV
jgi:hypothetical protein